MEIDKDRKTSKSCNDKAIERLQILGVSKYLDWFEEPVLYEEHIPNYKFWNTLPTKNLGIIDVPLKNVIGTNHVDYANNLWIENLAKLKRFNPCFTREYCLNYFNSLHQKTTIAIGKYGNDYIIGESNHRTHCAKFLDLAYIKANVVERFFDFELYNRIMDCEQFGFSISDQIYRKGTWKIKLNDVIFFIYEFEMLNHFVSLLKSTRPTQFETKQIKLKIMFTMKSRSIENNFYHLKEIADFDKKTILIIKTYKVTINNDLSIYL